MKHDKVLNKAFGTLEALPMMELENATTSRRAWERVAVQEQRDLMLRKVAVVAQTISVRLSASNSR